MLFDTHTHINTMVELKDSDVFIQEALVNGIGKMICVGFDLKSSEQAIEWAKKHPGIVYAAVGIHPTECNATNEDDLAQIAAWLQLKEVVALGEIGLDYHWDTVHPTKQKIIFTKQLELAKKQKKPVIIHCREALKDTYDILKNSQVALIGGIMHSYPGSVEMTKDFLDLNMFISISGVVTFKNNHKTKQVVKQVPLERLLIETDCPYLTPEPYRGKTNYPWYTQYVAQQIAYERNMNVEDVMAKTYVNACKLFNIDHEK